MTSCQEPSAFKALCAHPSTMSTSFDISSSYSSPFHLPVIHPALLSNTHLLHLNAYNPSSYDPTERIFEHNNNSDKAESSWSSRGSSHDSSSPTSTGGSSRENVIVRNDVKRKKGQVKDEAYWERRRKNNDAAKRSRDQRRQKEDEMASRAANLEHENMRLRVELDQLRSETEQLRALILSPSTSLKIANPSTLLLAATPTSSSVITTSQIFTPLAPVQIPTTPPSIRSSVLVTSSTKT